MHDAGLTALSAPSSGVRGSGAKWGITLVLLLAVMTAFFDRINIAVLFTNRSFHAAIGVGDDPALMGLLMTAFVFAYGISAMILSISGDFLGPRKTLLIITVVLAVVMALMGASSSYALMITGRVLLGAAEGPQFGAANATVKRWFPVRQHSRANAMWTIGSPLGSAIGFPLIIYLVAQFGWRASFYALAALNAVVVLPIIWFFLKDGPEAAHPAAEARPERATASASGAGAASLREGIGLVARDWRFWLLALYDCGAMIFLWGFNSWLPAYLQKARHFDLAHTGFYASLPFVLMLAGQFAGAWIGDRTGRRAAICGAGLLLAGVSIYLAAIVPEATTAALCLALSAAFWGMTVPTLFAIGLQIVPSQVTAAGFGIYAGLANLVGSAAPFVMGAIIGRTGNFAAGLYFLVIACVVLSLSMVPLLRKH